MQISNLPLTFKFFPSYIAYKGLTKKKYEIRNLITANLFYFDIFSIFNDRNIRSTQSKTALNLNRPQLQSGG